jgi:hypothetical protein
VPCQDDQARSRIDRQALAQDADFLDAVPEVVGEAPMPELQPVATCRVAIHFLSAMGPTQQ